MVGVVERKNTAAEGVADRASSEGSGSESWKVGTQSRTFDGGVFVGGWVAEKKVRVKQVETTPSFLG
jgi:hypothetical protein